MESAEDKLLTEKIEAIDEHPSVELNEDGTRTLTLSRPIPLGGDKELSRLEFKDEMTVADLEESDKGKGNVSSAARLISSMTGVSYGNLRKLGAKDFQTATLIIGKLSGNDYETGGTQ